LGDSQQHHCCGSRSRRSQKESSDAKSKACGSQLKSSRCFLGQAHHRCNESSEAFAALSFDRPAERQSAIRLGAHNRSEKKVAGFDAPVGRCSSRVVVYRRRAALCASLRARANLGSAHARHYEFKTTGGERTLEVGWIGSRRDRTTEGHFETRTLTERFRRPMAKQAVSRRAHLSREGDAGTRWK